MAELKTRPSEASVMDFLLTVEPLSKREDSLQLLKIFETITQQKPQLWGTSIVGFGMYHYQSSRSSQQGDWPLIAFSPRKQNLTIYIMPGFKNYQALIEKLGKCKTSVSCLYINKLKDVNLNVLEKIIQQSYLDMKQKYS